jgi:hypothetical protein
MEENKNISLNSTAAARNLPPRLISTAASTTNSVL